MNKNSSVPSSTRVSPCAPGKVVPHASRILPERSYIKMLFFWMCRGHDQRGFYPTPFRDSLLQGNY